MKYQIHYKANSQLGWRRPDNFYHCMEWQTTFGIIEELSNYLSDEWKLIVTGENDLPDLEGHDPKKVIVFQISDERYGIPAFASQVGFVFKHYVKSDVEAGNVRPIPQGLMTGFVRLPYRAPKDRSIDVFFSGNWHTSRRRILEGLKTRLQDKFNVVFLQNNAVSMVQPTYSHYMMDSKMVLDLSGALGPETFRYYEGLASGCAVLSYEKPNNWIYNDSPAIIPDWNDLDHTANLITELLTKGYEIDYACSESKAHYDKRFSCTSIVKNHIIPYIKDAI